MCETCNQWYHADCQSVHTKTYSELVNDSAIAWDCIVCDCPNYSSVCFEHVVSTSNHYSVLSDTSIASPTHCANILPVHASTPTRKQNRKQKATPIKLLNVNCQSIKTKQCRIKNLIDSSKPDIVCTETWVDPSITDSQIFRLSKQKLSELPST